MADSFHVQKPQTEMNALFSGGKCSLNHQSMQMLFFPLVSVQETNSLPDKGRNSYFRRA